MSDIFVKTASSGSTGWKKASRIWSKTAGSGSTGWKEATGVWIRNATQWLKVWPISGIFASRVPYIGYFSSDTYANRMPSATYPTIRIGDSYFGDNAQWDLNGFSASSYTYKWKLYDQFDSDLSITLRSGTGSGWTSTVGEDQLPTSVWTSTNSTNADNQFLRFEVTANNSSNSQYNGISLSTKIKVLRERPVNSTKTLSTNSPTIGSTITYSSTWASGEAYKDESARRSIQWYNNSSSTTTGGSAATGTGSTTATYTPNANDSGKYLYVVETRYNSGTDYDLGTSTGISATAITSSAVTAAIAAPTISSITASSIGGPVSVSFAGGSGPFYQMFWWGTATAPTGITTPDASGSASPLTDNTGPTSTATQYMYVRSVTTQSDTGVANGTTISPWSAGVSFNMTTASALTPTFGTNTSTANGFTGSVTNYDSAYTWNTPSNGSFTLTNGTWTWATASGATRSFTVTGLSASQSSTATVTTTRSGYTSGSANTTGTASALPKYTVTWGANGGTGGGSTGPFDSGTSHTAPSPGTKTGFDFQHYRYPASGGTDPVFVASGGSYTPTADRTFGAIWAAITYSVTFNANSGTGAPATQTKTYGTDLTLSSTAPTRATVGSTSYTFNGWNTASDGTGTNYSAGGTYSTNAALSLFAKWTANTATSYTVSYSANGGAASPSVPANQVTTGTITVATRPAFTRTNCALGAGWNTNTAGTGTNYANGASLTPTADTVLYAKWTANPVTFTNPTVTFTGTTGSGATTKRNWSWTAGSVTGAAANGYEWSISSTSGTSGFGAFTATTATTLQVTASTSRWLKVRKVGTDGLGSKVVSGTNNGV